MGDYLEEKYHKTRLFPEKTMRLLECFFHERTRIRPRNGLSAKGHESGTKDLSTKGHESGTKDLSTKGRESGTKDLSTKEHESGRRKDTYNNIKDTGSHDLTRSGNIGVTTTQQMAESEIEYRRHLYFEIVFADIDKLLTLPIY